jgi:hypothetical protein
MDIGIQECASVLIKCDKGKTYLRLYNPQSGFAYYIAGKKGWEFCKFKKIESMEKIYQLYAGKHDVCH